jgi:hypothetical protein
MRQKHILLSLIFIIIIAPATGCYYYHEPEFKGTILDIDTKQPLKGAVVVVEYWKASLGLVESPSSIINVKETLTNMEGNFSISSYTTFIQPFSWQIPNRIIIFKPGYASLKLGTEYFVGDELQEVREGSWPWTKELKYKLRGRGIVELPRLRSREEIVKRMLSFPTGYGAKELPLLYNAYEEEQREYYREK